MTGVVPSSHGAARTAAGAWLRDALLPWWHANIVAPDGSSYESVDGDGVVTRDAPRTLLTQARLVYVWSHAYLLTGDARYLASAERGCVYIEQSLGDARDGWRMSAASSERDCYDHAFVLFALAWLARASGDDRYEACAEATWDYLQRALGDPVHGGFHERASSQTEARRQNPHMHLLEACLAWHETTGGMHWLARADVLIGLLLTRFIDPANGSLIEHFDAQWSVAPGAAGTLREPGHHFEWVWLLRWRERLGASARSHAMAQVSARLWTFGNTHGIERSVAPQGLAFDEIDDDGALRTSSKLVWPQTELIKAHLAHAEREHDIASLREAERVLMTVQASHFDKQHLRWRNRVARDGTPLVHAAPTRLLYHVVLAAAELDRVSAQFADAPR